MKHSRYVAKSQETIPGNKDLMLWVIKAIAEKVHENIVDLRLKVLVINSCFITGGCFKALYSGEPVNDFDFYFKTKESAEKFMELIDKGLEKPASDPFTNQEKFKLAFKHKSQFALSFNLENNTKIQFITKYYGTPEKVVGNFDFAHCTNYYDLATDSFVFDENKLKDKKLVFNPTATHPINALKRMQKFIKQGWAIEDDELMKISVAISALNLSNPEVFEEQSAGMYISDKSNNLDTFKKNHINISNDDWT